MSKVEVQHQENEELFFIVLDDGQNAFLRYRYTEPRADGTAVDFFSTFVPSDHRGKGLAAQLVDHGFAWAAEQNLSVQTSCWYAAKRKAESEN